jgi:hypothetical protein
MEVRLLKWQDRQSPEQRAAFFQMKMLKGDLRGAVKHLTESEKGGVLMPDQIYDKTGLTIKEVLQSKHPSATTPHHSTLHPYDEVPAFADLDISHDTIAGGSSPVWIRRLGWCEFSSSISLDSSLWKFQ